MDRQGRLAAVLRRMAADGIDTLVAASNGLPGIDVADAGTFLSGFRSTGESLFVLRSDGRATLIAVPAADEERATARVGDFASVIATDNLAGALIAELAGGNGRVAHAGVTNLPHGLAARILGALGEGPRDVDTAVFAAAGAKIDEEAARARKAAEIADKGWDRLLAVARPGQRECDLAVEVELYMKSLGADDNFLMLNAGPHNRAVMPSSHRRLERGDVILVELTPSYDGQFAQICRTATVGTPAPVMREKYDLVVRAMNAGIAAIRPGLPMAEVCASINRVLEAEGYGEYCHPPHMRRRGHGLGCGTTAPGDVATDNPILLEEGMIFVVHPNQYLPETGYMMCGEPVRVTATGVEILSPRQAALGVVAA